MKLYFEHVAAPNRPKAPSPAKEDKEAWARAERFMELLPETRARRGLQPVDVDSPEFKQPPQLIEAKAESI